LEPRARGVASAARERERDEGRDGARRVREAREGRLVLAARDVPRELAIAGRERRDRRELGAVVGAGARGEVAPREARRGVVGAGEAGVGGLREAHEPALRVALAGARLGGGEEHGRDRRELARLERRRGGEEAALGGAAADERDRAGREGVLEAAEQALE